MYPSFAFGGEDEVRSISNCLLFRALRGRLHVFQRLVLPVAGPDGKLNFVDELVTQFRLVDLRRNP